MVAQLGEQQSQQEGLGKGRNGPQARNKTAEWETVAVQSYWGAESWRKARRMEL